MTLIDLRIGKRNHSTGVKGSNANVIQPRFFKMCMKRVLFKFQFGLVQRVQLVYVYTLHFENSDLTIWCFKIS